jgi:hypothetical protein
MGSTSSTPKDAVKKNGASHGGAAQVPRTQIRASASQIPGSFAVCVKPTTGAKKLWFALKPRTRIKVRQQPFEL